MSGGAHRYMIHCSSGLADPLESQWLALLPHDSPGIARIGDWDTLGMRATVSPAMQLDNCFVGPDAPLGRPGEAPRAGVTQGFGLGFAAVYLGAAQAALDFIKEFARTQTFAPDPAPIAEAPVVQRTIAEMSMAIEGARRVLHSGASEWADASPAERAVLSARAKYLATVASLDVTSKAIQIAGGAERSQADAAGAAVPGRAYIDPYAAKPRPLPGDHWPVRAWTGCLTIPRRLTSCRCPGTVLQPRTSEIPVDHVRRTGRHKRS